MGVIINYIISGIINHY